MQIRFLGTAAASAAAAVIAAVSGEPAAHAAIVASAAQQAAAAEGITQMAQSGTLGPFATMRRALEVADQYRSHGFNANAYPNGGAYWVRVWR